MARRSTPRVFAVPPAVPVLPALVHALLAGELIPGLDDRADPAALCDLTILMPSRRAARAAEACLLRARGGAATMLPRIKALPEVDEAELLLSQMAAIGHSAAAELPPALSAFDRAFGLYGLVERQLEELRKEQGDGGTRAYPAEIVHLASVLGKIFDAVALEEGDLARLDGFVPDAFDTYWQHSADYLRIVREHWPAALTEWGRLDPGERWRRLLEIETARIAAGDGGPIVAVAPNVASPQIARLLDAVARRPDGAVVLPGLDLELDALSWAHIEGEAEGPEPSPTHPQHGPARLLKAIGLTRADVEPLTGAGTPGEGTPVGAVRAVILSEALRPAATTDLWGALATRRDGAAWDAALEGVALVEARGEREEAVAIALLLREAAETPGKTAALVTPDRTIARRVSAELARFGLAVDDSAGVPLARTPPAVFAQLLIETVADEVSPVTLLALLKHPLATFGLPRETVRTAARLVERAVLRGPRPASGMRGLRAALERLPADVEARRRRIELKGSQLELAFDLVERIETALGPLEEAAQAGPSPLAELVQLHIEALDFAARTPDGDPLFATENGEALAAFLFDLLEARHNGLSVPVADYPALLGALMADRLVRPRAPSHPRLHIWGPLEARLQTVDRIVLAGLNEGTWPPEPQPDPWLNRAMRKAVGLPPPERLAGVAAHDFVGAFACGEVLLVRSLRSAGDPTVPSRLLARLQAVAGSERVAQMRARGGRVLGWARALDLPPTVQPEPRPQPRPPVAARPRRLSVTEIESWLRDPYTIYARHVLRLRPLDDIAEVPAAAERGTVIHDAVAAFAMSEHAGRRGEEALAALIAAGRAGFEPYRNHTPVLTLWWPRFETMAAWIVAFEEERRTRALHVLAECQGVWTLHVEGAAPFELVGRADRVERLKDGRLAVLDFKTGSVPSPKEMKVGFAPQLALLGLMAAEGAFDADHRGSGVAELAYVKLGREPEMVDRFTGREARPVAEAMLAARAGLAKLILEFENEARGYSSMPRPQFRLRYGEYDHLARVREWSLVEEPEA